MPSTWNLSLNPICYGFHEEDRDTQIEKRKRSTLKARGTSKGEPLLISDPSYMHG